MRRWNLRAHKKSRNETGSVSLWLVLFAFAVLILLAFIVDGGQYMNAKERAADIAEQAARAGADQVSVAALRQGEFTIPEGPACGAAGELVGQYATGAQAGAKMGPCSVNGVTVTFQVDVSVTPVLPFWEAGSIKIEATESATLDCGNAVASTGAC
jgi:Flp pilus assembly protein TadG